MLLLCSQLPHGFPSTLKTYNSIKDAQPLSWAPDSCLAYPFACLAGKPKTTLVYNRTSVSLHLKACPSTIFPIKERWHHYTQVASQKSELFLSPLPLSPPHYSVYQQVLLYSEYIPNIYTSLLIYFQPLGHSPHHLSPGQLP